MDRVIKVPALTVNVWNLLQCGLFLLTFGRHKRTQINTRDKRQEKGKNAVKTANSSLLHPQEFCPFHLTSLGWRGRVRRDVYCSTGNETFHAHVAERR